MRFSYCVISMHPLVQADNSSYSRINLTWFQCSLVNHLKGNRLLLVKGKKQRGSITEWCIKQGAQAPLRRDLSSWWSYCDEAWKLHLDKSLPPTVVAVGWVPIPLNMNYQLTQPQCNKTDWDTIKTVSLLRTPFSARQCQSPNPSRLEIPNSYSQCLNISRFVPQALWAGTCRKIFII